MTVALKGTGVQASAGTSSTTVAATRTDVAAGDIVIVYVAQLTSTKATITLTDNKTGGSHTYTALSASVDRPPTDDLSIRQFAVVALTTQSLTVTCTYGSAQGFRGIWLELVSGASALPTGAACTGQGQTNPGAGANAITSGTAIPDSGAAAWLVVGFSNNNDTITPAPGVGTGFTIGINGWDFGQGVGSGATSEAKRVTSGSAVAATFTSASNKNYTTFVAIFPETGSGTNTPKTITANQAQTPTVGRNIQKVLTASHTQTATRARGVGRVLSGNQTQTPGNAPTIGTAVNVAITQTQTPTRVRGVNATKSANQTQTGSRVMGIGAPKSANETQTSSLVKGQGFFRAFTATATQTATRVLALALARSASETQTPADSRGVARPLATAQAQTIAMIRALAVAMSAAETQSPSVAKGAGHLVTIAVTNSQTGARVLSVGRQLSASAAQTASRLRALALSRSATSSQSPSVLVVPSGGGAHLMTLTAAVTQTAAVVRGLGRALSATATQAASRVRTVAPSAKSTSQAQTPSMVKGSGHLVNLAVTALQSPTISKGLAVGRSVTSSQAAAVVRGIGKLRAFAQTQFPSLSILTGSLISFRVNRLKSPGGSIKRKYRTR